MGRETCTWSVLQFCIFIAGREKKCGGAAAGQGKVAAAGSPAQTGRLCGTKRISSTLCHFSAKVQPQELPEQPKLRDEDTSRERLIRHFPVTTGQPTPGLFLSPPEEDGTGLPAYPPVAPFQQCPQLQHQHRSISFLPFLAHSPLSQGGIGGAIFFLSFLPRPQLTFAAETFVEKWHVWTSDAPCTES